jgi:adenine-specific DNA-methyltransferase
MMKVEISNIDKLRGGYYTPFELATWLCDWAIRTAKDTVFEPSCGDGVFLRAAGSRLAELGVPRNKTGERLQGVELIDDEAIQARETFLAQLNAKTPPKVEASDLFQWLLDNPSERYDVVVGNPPFIRYQNFPEPSRSLAMAMMKEQGLRPNKLTNTWVPFVVAATMRLRPGGRLAMIVPAELLQVSYAGQLRLFLVDQFRRIEIVTCNEMFFDGAEQEVVLLLADGKLEKASPENRCLINMSEFHTVAELLKSTPVPEIETKKIIQHDSEKWLKYFLTVREIDFMRRLRQSANVTELKTHASIDVGVVTGKNEFFVLNQEQTVANGLQDYKLPLVGRSAQLEGAIFSGTDFKTLVKENSRIYLFYVSPDANGSLSQEVRHYIAQGEAEEVHKGYKCSIRTPWFTVPTVWKPDCFLFRQIYDFPRAVVNQTKATSTDTIHRMTCKGDSAAVAASLYTHLTGASAEIEGRSYGGGVLELEPTEAERLLMPTTLGGGLSIEEVDLRIRAGGLEAVLEENDRLILKAKLGLTDAECKLLKGIWDKMRTRRRMRGKRK